MLNHYKKLIPLIFLLEFISVFVFAQQLKYTVSNAHAHNDYLHPVPFYSAYNAGFGSIESDIFLINDNLYVAHNIKDIDTARTLQKLYLDPLQQLIQKNKGHIYADHSKNLILLIDLKTNADSTLQALVHVLQRYTIITRCAGVKLVITGNQPDISLLTSYPSYILFDGDLKNKYTGEELNRIALFSGNFKNFSDWNGNGRIAEPDRGKLDSAIDYAHASNKPIRFWNAPDFLGAWLQLMNLKVDLINTDKIKEISLFLNKFSPGSGNNKKQHRLHEPLLHQ